MSHNIDLKLLYSNIEDDQKLANELKDIINRINLIKIDNYNKMTEANIIILITNLANEKTKLELKLNEVEKLNVQLKVKLDELRINLDGILYLNQLNFSFHQFGLIQSRLIDFQSVLEKNIFKCQHKSTIFVEDENKALIPLNQANLSKLFNLLSLIYNQVNHKLDIVCSIKKEAMVTWHKVQSQLSELGKVVFKKKIKLNQKELIQSSISISTILELEQANKLRYYTFNIVSWLIPSVIVTILVFLIVYDPFNFEPTF